MIYKPFKDIRLSRLGMGNMRLPGTGRDEKIDYEEAFKVIDAAYQGGVNYYDTAYVYNGGDSERCVGEAMKRYPRDSFYLATKFNYRANPDYRAVFEEQLERLRTDHIDFYLIHCLQESNIENYLNCGCIEFFENMQRKGRITYLGFSSHAKPETLRRFADRRAWDFAQIQMNYLDWEFRTTEEEYNILTERNIPIIVMESVRGGKLASLPKELESRLRESEPDRSTSSWAFRWLMNHPNVHVMLSGMSTVDQVMDNLDTFKEDNPLDDRQMALIRQVAHDFKASLTVPCTACRYCTATCPAGLEIPDLLRIYNRYKYGDWWRNDLVGLQEDRMPKHCISCGQCVEHCPQNIDVPTYMAKLARLIETGSED